MRPMLALLQSRCTDASLKLDIGANIGGYTHLMLDWPGQIHAFEPIVALAHEVAQRFVNEPRVTVFPVGVSNHEFSDAGYAVFEAWTLDKPERAVRGRNQDALARFGEQTFAVEFVTIDEHMKRWCGVDLRDTGWIPPRVDFIKLDTDGYEYRVLKGAKETLLRDRPPIYIEFGYMVADIGDSIPEFLHLIYETLAYVVVTEDGIVRDHAYWLTNYPMHTTYDVGLIPKERLAEFGF